jgi:4-oxalocrotonate tautomerase family enzyme
MPNIFVHWLEGKKKEQKQMVVEGFTKVMEEAGINKDAVSIAFIENSPDNVAIGGVFLSERKQ